MRKDESVLSLRVNAPAALSGAVREYLEHEPSVSALTVIPGGSASPPGDLIIADVPRERANDLIDDLVALGVQDEGTIAVQPVETWVSRRGLAAEEAAPGMGQDAVVWAQVTERAYSESALTWTYASFMVLATLLAAIAIVTGSTVLIIGAMVLGPEFVPIAALGLGLVRRRPMLVQRALRTLAIGFAISIGVTTLLALLLRALHVLTGNVDLEARTATSFIYEPNLWSLVVAVIAGAAGVLALTAAKGNGLVGVFISVTTIPASGNVALALALGVWSQALGSVLQLVINIIGMALAGWATLALQQSVWRRYERRQFRRARS